MNYPSDPEPKIPLDAAPVSEYTIRYFSSVSLSPQSSDVHFPPMTGADAPPPISPRATAIRTPNKKAETSRKQIARV